MKKGNFSIPNLKKKLGTLIEEKIAFENPPESITSSVQYIQTNCILMQRKKSTTFQPKAPLQID